MPEATSAKAALWKTSSLGIMYGLSPTWAATIEPPAASSTRKKATVARLRR